MNPTLVATLLIAATLSAVAAPIPDDQLKLIESTRYDLVVVGSAPGGIACAVRAAREGLSVLLVERTQHIGGFMTSGAGGWEAPYDGLRSPLYAEIRNQATEHYRATYGEGSQQHLASQPKPTGNRHIDRPKIEPRIAEMLFDRMTAGEKSLTVLRGFIAVSAHRDDATVKVVRLKEYEGGRSIRVQAAIWADGSYEGDLAAVCKAPYRVGREARGEYDEPHAGVMFTAGCPKAEGANGRYPRDAAEGRLNIRAFPMCNETILPESTGEADPAVMAYNYRIILTDDPANRVPVPMPPGYDPKTFKGTTGGGFVPDLPNRKIALNAGRLIGPQVGYPDGDWPTREKISEQYLNYIVGQVYYLQNDPGVSEPTRKKWAAYGLAKDEFPDNHNLPYEVYVREARRIVGRYIFTEHDGKPAPGIERTPIHYDSVAITDWPLDSVACTKRKAGKKGSQDGIMFQSCSSRPAMVPYRSLIPNGVDNLLVPVCLSATHVGWGAIRLEPVWMQTGEAAGFAAAQAVRTKKTPATIDTDLFMRTLSERHFMVSFFNDVDVTSDAPWLAAVEFLGTRGYFRSYDARPGDPLTKATADAWSQTFLKPPGETDAARRLPDEDNGSPITTADFAAQLAGGPAALAVLKLDPAAPITRGDACRLVYHLLARPAHGG